MEITSPASGSVSISFFVEEGSQSITYFLINITNAGSSETPTQLTVTLNDSTLVSSREEIVDSETGLLIGYTVVLTLTELEKQGEFMFQVAAVSGLGVGDFSDPARFRLRKRMNTHIITIVLFEECYE